MKVLFTIAGLHPESGGPSHSVPALCQALGQNGVEVEIVSLDYGDTFGKPLEPAHQPPPLSALSPAQSGGEGGRRPGEGDVIHGHRDVKFVRTTQVDCSSAFARRMQWTPKFKSVLRERCRATGVQLVHDTGLWLLTNHAAAAVCQELKLPLIVSPRGMLTTWALRHKGWKKRIAWALYQRRDLLTAQVLHATSPAEVQDFRAAGLKQPIAMIPNGVELPPRVGDGRWKMLSHLLSPISNLLAARAHLLSPICNLLAKRSQLLSPISNLLAARAPRSSSTAFIRSRACWIWLRRGGWFGQPVGALLLRDAMKGGT